MKFLANTGQNVSFILNVQGKGDQRFCPAEQKSKKVNAITDVRCRVRTCRQIVHLTSFKHQYLFNYS